MSKLGSYAQSANETVECPINVFLENIKGQLGAWNKEKKENDFYDLESFVILNVGYTIKWQVWDDSIKKYTATYFSNEVHSFNETFYAIEMTFSDGKAFKKLAAKGLWNDKEVPANSVKGKMPMGIGLKVGITVFDLNDNTVKEFFVGISDFINNIQPTLRDSDPTNVYKLDITKVYTNGSKDEKWQEVFISEAELDKMKWSDAAKYKNRYVSQLDILGQADETQVKNAEDKLELLEKYLDSKKEFYKNTYGEDNKSSESEKNYAPEPTWIQSDEEFKEEVKSKPVVKAQGETQKHNTTWDISIEDIPF